MLVLFALMAARGIVVPYKDPEAARAYQRERKRIERAGERTTPRK